VRVQIRASIEQACGRWDEAAAGFRRAAALWAELPDAPSAALAAWMARRCADAARGLGPAAWDAGADELAQLDPGRADLQALAWEELLRLAPDPERARRARAAREATLGPASAALLARPALLAGAAPPPGWGPERLPQEGEPIHEDGGATLDELLAVALRRRVDPGLTAPLSRLCAEAARGLLSAQAAALRARLGLG
jgi:hypothetical protein